MYFAFAGVTEKLKKQQYKTTGDNNMHDNTMIGSLTNNNNVGWWYAYVSIYRWVSK